MNARQVILLIVAAIAAIGFALLVNGMFFGGGRAKDASGASAVRPASVSILVAARNISPGEALNDTMVAWQSWPRDTADASFIRGDGRAPAASLVEGAVARAPMVKGEPLTYTKIIRSGASGVMAASLSPGMRAVSVPASTVTGAGGFIQPGNRVDVVLTSNVGGKVAASIILTNIRVLAVDQAFDTVAAKAASELHMVTFELTPAQVKFLAQKQTMGQLSLALRPLVDTESGAITIVRGESGPSDEGR